MKDQHTGEQAAQRDKETPAKNGLRKLSASPPKRTISALVSALASDAKYRLKQTFNRVEALEPQESTSQARYVRIHYPRSEPRTPLSDNQKEARAHLAHAQELADIPESPLESRVAPGAPINFSKPFRSPGPFVELPAARKNNESQRQLDPRLRGPSGRAY